MTLDADRYTISRHAAARIVDMALDVEEVIACITRPETIREAPLKYPGRVLHDHGRVTLAIEPQPDGTLVVLTALWATKELWEADYALPCADGRIRRADPFRSDT